MLNPSKLCVEGIYILLGEPDDTLNIPQLNETQTLVTIFLPRRENAIHKEPPVTQSSGMYLNHLYYNIPSFPHINQLTIFEYFVQLA